MNKDAEEFESAGKSKRNQSALSGLVSMVWENKKWWMIPIIVMLLLMGLLILLSGSAAAPFIYTLF